MNSCDASAWLGSVRWGEHWATAANKNAWKLGHGFNYVIGDEENGVPIHWKARAFCGYDAHFSSHMMSVMAADAKASVGAELGAFR